MSSHSGSAWCHWRNCCHCHSSSPQTKSSLGCSHSTDLHLCSGVRREKIGCWDGACCSQSESSCCCETWRWRKSLLLHCAISWTAVVGEPGSTLCHWNQWCCCRPVELPCLCWWSLHLTPFHSATHEYSHLLTGIVCCLSCLRSHWVLPLLDHLIKGIVVISYPVLCPCRTCSWSSQTWLFSLPSLSAATH